MSNATSDRYSHLARLLHWVSALVIVWATVTGFYAAFWAGTEVKAYLSYINVSLTTLLIPVFALRVGVRLFARQPDPLDLPSHERLAARIGHLALYGLTALVLASGVLMMKHDIHVFDWLSIPRPMADAAVNEYAELVYRLAASVLCLTVLIHIAAVIRHERRGTRVLRRMLWPRPAAARSAPSTAAARAYTDASGRAVFSAGEAGAAHVLAHRLLDEGRVVEGRRLLGSWLAARHGSGSEWVHLHFHAALFELALDDWDAAYQRFTDHILPAAANTEDALTDAPALLWRLQLLAPRSVELPWEPLRRTALERMQRPSEPFVALHNLLALAGAGDLENIDRWVRAQPLCDDTGRECLLRRIGEVLKAYAGRAYQQAAEALEGLLPHLCELGGSLAQNGLFEELATASRRLQARTGQA